MAIVKPRNEIDPKFKWKLEKIYASNEAFEEELAKLKEEALVLMNYKEKLHEKESLLSYLKDFEKYTRVLEKLSKAVTDDEIVEGEE